MTIEQLLKCKPVFVYSEVDDETATSNFDLEGIKSVIESHNEYFNTEYKTINDFNDGEYHRKIEIQL